mmetsp:Transcript_2003/g.5956  ORF Transcript_2003/g.5956 Transcript_2003/m.5956 type:complete len:390 (+) Transcript_2003:880-2049(+)
MLTCAQCGVAHWAAQERVVREFEREGPRGTVHLQPAIRVLLVVCHDAINDVVRLAVCKVLGRFPIERVGVVYAGVPEEYHVAAAVLPDEHVMPIELVLDDIWRHEPIVPAIQRKFVTPGQHVTIVVPDEVPGVLVVQVKAIPLVVVVHIAFELSEGRVLRANLAVRVALPVLVGAARRVQAVLIAGDAVVEEVVRHADEINPATLDAGLAEPRHRAHLPPRTNHHVVADDVVHLVAVLRVDARRASVPQDVAVNEGVVGAVDCDSDLLPVDDSVALEDAFRAIAHHVHVQAILAHLVPAAAVLDARVPDIDDARVHHHGGEAFKGFVEVVAVSGDNHRPFEVHNLCRHLERVPFNDLEPAQVVGLDRRVQHDHGGHRPPHHAAEDADLI